MHLRSLISAFVIRLLEGTISKLATRELSIFLVSPCSWAGWFESHFVDRFSHVAAHLKAEKKGPQKRRLLTNCTIWAAGIGQLPNSAIWQEFTFCAKFHYIFWMKGPDPMANLGHSCPYMFEGHFSHTGSLTDTQIEKIYLKNENLSSQKYTLNLSLNHQLLN